MSEFRNTNIGIGRAPLAMNAVKCLACGKVMESTYRHDFRSCNCPNHTFVDGGLDYQRFGGQDMKLVAVYRDGEYINWLDLD